MVTSYYLKGLTDANIYAVNPVKITICGNETLSPLVNEEHHFEVPQEDNEYFYITSGTLESFFVFDKGVSS